MSYYVIYEREMALMWYGVLDVLWFGWCSEHQKATNLVTKRCCLEAEIVVVPSLIYENQWSFWYCFAQCLEAFTE
jgi:hypothetical protein